ncbi:MAG: radical SAM family heme chaperone HemW [Terracidiphilus sp.]|jgi:oxygen-independent coproporphyrinogen-3 oxidase
MMIREDNALGIYVSIPFCRAKCTYCNFASGVYPVSEHGRYVERLIADLGAAGEWAAVMGVELPRRVDTVYLGGGTPSLLAPELLEKLFGAVRAEFELEPDAEITVECAPGQIADETLEALAVAGVNRVSLGVQSFVDREARASGRVHTRAVVEEDLRRLRDAGIGNLSVDLIAGLAGQTEDSWEESLAAVVDAEVPHASVYMLEVDEDSRLGREVLGGGARYFAEKVPEDDAIARMYSTAIERLGRAGLWQYEISNFCRAGFASRHNLRYWERRPYLGVGLDASLMLKIETPGAATTTGSEDTFPQGLKPNVLSGPSSARLKPRPFKTSEPGEGSADFRKGYVLRSTTTDDLAAFVDGAEMAEMAWLSPEKQHEEAWFLGLRLNAGVDVGAVEREFGAEMAARAMEVVGRLAEDGLVSSDGRTVGLTERGRLLSNDVFQEFLGLEEEACVKVDGAGKARA